MYYICNSVILGVDFLEHYNKEGIDFKNGKIYLKGKVVSANMYVPAGSENDIKVKIARRKYKKIVLSEPVKYLHDSSIGGAKCLVTVRKGLGHVALSSNMSGYRCESDCRSKGRKFDKGPV